MSHVHFSQPPEVQPPSAETLAFIQSHCTQSPHDIALHTPKTANIDLPFALNQIAGRHIARTKLPQWYACNAIMYPIHLSMEQCSSEQTARYKQKIASALLLMIQQHTSQASNTPLNTTLIDCTGGFGVDCCLLAPLFDHVIYCESNPELAGIAQHNMKALQLSHVQCYNADIETALDHFDELHLQQATMLFIDPARRTRSGARAYAINDCTPNVLGMLPRMLKLAPLIMIKLSPMLDWSKAVCDFHGHVNQVHIVSHANECKELLLTLTRQITTTLSVHCVQDDQTIVFNALYDPQTQQVTTLNDPVEYADHNSEQSLSDWKTWAHYVYEPYASLMKAGCFSLLEQRYHVRELAPNSHVFISHEYQPDFPGNHWCIENVGSLNKREARQLTAGLSHANIVTRNFPLSAEQLAKRLKLNNGGSTRLIGTTDIQRQHVLIRARSVQ